MTSVVRVLVALGFLGIGAVHLFAYLRLTRRPDVSGRRAGQLDQIAHLLMAVAMAAMVWPRPVLDRWGLQAAVFALVTGWFVTRAVAGRRALLPHALAGAAMTGMLAAPLVTSGAAGASATGTAAGTVAGHGAGHGGMAMPGMAGDGAVGGARLAVLVGCCLLVSAAWWLVDAYRAGRRSAASPERPVAGDRARRLAGGPVAGALAHAAMAAGMAAMLLPLR